MSVAAVSPGPDRVPVAATEVLAARHAVTFLPADPPRLGVLVVYDRFPASTADASGFPDEVEVVLPNASGNGVRRRTVAARRLPIAEAIP